MLIPRFQLMDAIKRNSPSLVREALEAGATIDDIYHDGKKALEYAQVCDAPEAARELVKHGADVNMTVGKRGQTLVAKCLKVGDYGFMSLLLELGADGTKLKGEGYFADRIAKSNSWAR
jgi:ankyrin repeat protein